MDQQDCYPLHLLCYPSFQFASSSPDVRAMACRAVSHLVFELPSVELLMSQHLVKKVAPLLVDTTMAVREAAAGALRYGEIYSWAFVKEPDSLHHKSDYKILKGVVSLQYLCLCYPGHEASSMCLNGDYTSGRASLLMPHGLSYSYLVHTSVGSDCVHQPVCTQGPITTGSQKRS